MRLDPQLAILLATSTGAGFLMLVSGIQKSALEWRRRKRTCPSCGRHMNARVCSGCGSA